MRTETKEALYILAIVISAFSGFYLGQYVDNKCAIATEIKREKILSGREKAAAAKLDFCVKNKPSLDNNGEVLNKYSMFKKIKCPERLLYAECDADCREELIKDMSLDILYWEEDSSYRELPPVEEYYPEP